jgi:hypothetical protein
MFPFGHIARTNNPTRRDNSPGTFDQYNPKLITIFCNNTLFICRCNKKAVPLQPISIKRKI